MAYPTVSAPYGLRPLNRLDGVAYSGATRTYRIASTYNTPIFNGDLVILVTGGTIEKFTGTDAGFPVGVFMGCNYTSSQGQPLQAQYYPGTSVTNASAMVIVDSTAVYSVAVTNVSSVMSTADLASIGSNMSIVQGTGNTNTGDSAVSVLAGSQATTSTFPIRVVDVVPETATGANAFPELIVKINVAQFDNATGV
jgi:hypothetical protein